MKELSQKKHLILLFWHRIKHIIQSRNSLVIKRKPLRKIPSPSKKRSYVLLCIFSFLTPLIILLIIFFSFHGKTFIPSADKNEKIQSAIERVQTMPSYNNYIWLANAYYYNNQIDKGIEMYEKAKQIDSKRHEAYLNLCVLYYYTKKWAQAIGACESALEHSPGNERVIRYLEKAKKSIKN